METAERQRTRQGLLCAFGAYGLWGLIPLYFKVLAHVAPLEMLAHRIVWCFLLLVGVVVWRGRGRELRQALRTWPVVRTLFITTVLIGLNWLVFIHAVTSGQVLQTSLGYFIAPLMNVLLGVVFLGERMRSGQLAGIALAAVGVITLGVLGGQFPWIALSLAVSFGFYGLLRKTVAVDGLLGLLVETALILPVAGLYVAFLEGTDSGAFSTTGTATVVLLVLSGPVTAVPLLLFTEAARRLRLATLGFVQYLSPTLQFLSAVLLFGEPFSTPQLVSFGCIWAAVGVYTFDSLQAYRRRVRERKSPAGERLVPVTVSDV